MSITVTGRQMSVSEALRDYADEKIGNSLKVLDVDPIEGEIVLSVERNKAIANSCRCEVTLRIKGHVVHVDERESDMYAAIDVAAAKVLRQLRKFKTRVLERRKREGRSDDGSLKALNSKVGELDLDALMDELAADDEEVVRVKDLELEPLTEEQALVQIDLLDHDFFAYTDRDTGVFCVLYRRTNGGYGLLKQVIEEE